MFLLIRCWKISVSRSYLYLHSTMFLLILYPAEPDVFSDIEFTFHNVSINTSFSGACADSETVFTFHNVSINTTLSMRSHAFIFKFTFHNVSINTDWLYSRRIYGRYLHSTMFLLIPRPSLYCMRGCGYIYIPQCFY